MPPHAHPRTHTPLAYEPFYEGGFVTGETAASLGGPNAGLWDAFLARYDSAGNQLWIRQFGTTRSDLPFALAPDGAGGVMVAGETQGSLGGPNAGGWDVFLARYDGAGNQLWIRQFGTRQWERGTALAPDGAGGVMIAGHTLLGSLGGPNAGGWDVFLARYDSAGNQLWIRQFGTSNEEFAGALAPDGAGGVMVAGFTDGSLGGLSAGQNDAFLARYDSAGNRLWMRQFGTSGSDGASALAPDGAGGVIVAGYTGGDLGAPIPDPGPFLARYDSSGNRLWIRQFGGSESGVAHALAPDGAGGVMVAGETWGSLGGPNAGMNDVFLARFGEAACPCACDFDPDPACNIFDFLAFQTAFVAGEPCACEIDPDPACNIFDFLAFQTQFVTGCP